jgi:hypothetical protein
MLGKSVSISSGHVPKLSLFPGATKRPQETLFITCGTGNIILFTPFNVTNLEVFLGKIIYSDSLQNEA